MNVICVGGPSDGRRVEVPQEMLAGNCWRVDDPVEQSAFDRRIGLKAVSKTFTVYRFVPWQVSHDAKIYVLTVLSNEATMYRIINNYYPRKGS